MNIKRFLRFYIFSLAALWLVTQLIKGVTFAGGYQTLLLASLALTLVNLLVKPLVNLLLLPLNLLTLGAFRWVVNVAALYLVTLLVPQFKIEAFLFPGFSYQGFIIPPIHLNILWVFVLASLSISIITSFLFWLTK